ncbi:MAG: transposase [Chloroflexota bacterium]|nr:transposase [Chloroflexota bacterium]
MLDDLDLTGIQDERARALIVRLLNLIEDLSADLHTAQEKIQRLRDENNRLKGDQGKPDIKPNTPPPATDHSSERERYQPTKRVKRGKRATITIDREDVARVDRASLPPDAEFKGYEDVVVQDILIHTDNVLFHKEVFYSPAEQRSYRAVLPRGYSGAFGPGVKALALVLYFGCLMSEAKIRELFVNVGLQIAEGTISNRLIKDHAPFHAEKDAVYRAGLRSSPWQHIDDTSTRVNGQNQHCQVVCNPLYTAYHTTAAKDRLTIIDVLCNGQPRRFRLNAEALGYLAHIQVSQITRQHLLHLPWEQDLDAPTLERLLTDHLPHLGDQQRKWIVDALAVAAYHAQTEWPIVRLLVCDDAPQFTWVTADLALCWIHEGRHYKKLTPWVAGHRAALDDFLTDFWDFYDDLLVYRARPTREERARLTAAFDTLWATETDYWALNDRIAKTRAKKTALLLVLEHPEIPLHNNPAELGARQRVRKRDVSFGPRTTEGARAWDTFMSLADTTRKLGVSFYHFIHDRVTGANQMPALADIIDEQAQELNLGASWTAG